METAETEKKKTALNETSAICCCCCCLVSERNTCVKDGNVDVDFIFEKPGFPPVFLLRTLIFCSLSDIFHPISHGTHDSWMFLLYGFR